MMKDDSFIGIAFPAFHCTASSALLPLLSPVLAGIGLRAHRCGPRRKPARRVFLWCPRIGRGRGCFPGVGRQASRLHWPLRCHAPGFSSLSRHRPWPMFTRPPCRVCFACCDFVARVAIRGRAMALRCQSAALALPGCCTAELLRIVGAECSQEGIDG